LDQKSILYIIEKLADRDTHAREKIEIVDSLNEACFKTEAILETTINSICDVNVIFASKFKGTYEKWINPNFFRVCLGNLLKESHLQHKDTLLRYIDRCSQWTKPIALSDGLIMMIIEKDGYFNGVNGVLKVFGNFSKRNENIESFFQQGILDYICTNFDP
jgi:hypothetical protein